jgi:nitroreductase
MNDLLTALNWRYATKVFDSSKKIPVETWGQLEESLVLTPSSYGLQPWKFLIVQDEALREQLVPHAWSQRQIADCSHLVIMLVKKALSEADVDAFLSRMVEVRGGTADALAAYRGMVMGAQSKGYMSTDWAKKQAYIALGQFMLATALLSNFYRMAPAATILWSLSAIKVLVSLTMPPNWCCQNPFG